MDQFSSCSIQRLERPYATSLAAHHMTMLKDIPLKAHALLSEVFTFDKMQSFYITSPILAETLESLEKSIEHNEALMECFTVKTQESNVGPYKGGNSSSLYLIAKAHHIREAEQWIKLKAFNEWNKEVWTTEPASLEHAINCKVEGKEAKNYPLGWMEIYNEFMFFIDYDMFAKTCALFGVKPLEK